MTKLTHIWLRIALPGAMLTLLWFYSVYAAGQNPYYSFFQKLVILLHGAISLTSIWYYREKLNGGLLSFAESLFCGVSVSIIVAALAAIGIFLFAQYVQPITVAHHIADLKNYLLAQKEVLIKQTGIEMYEGNLKNVDTVTAGSIAIDAFVWKLIQGCMFSILAGLALRRAE